MVYSLELAREIARTLASGRQRVVDICTHFEISEPTFYRWKADIQEFRELLKTAEHQRRAALKEMALSGLAKLLDVHEVEDVLTEYVDRDGTPKIKSRKVTKRVIMPSTAAVIYTLNNTDPDHWQQRKTLEIVPPAPKRFDLTTLTDAELDLWLTLQAKAQTLLPAPDESDTSATLSPE